MYLYSGGGSALRRQDCIEIRHKRVLELAQVRVAGVTLALAQSGRGKPFDDAAIIKAWPNEASVWISNRFATTGDPTANPASKLYGRH